VQAVAKVVVCLFEIAQFENSYPKIRGLKMKKTFVNLPPAAAVPE
jgi:hypothetical protein